MNLEYIYQAAFDGHEFFIKKNPNSFFMKQSPMTLLHSRIDSIETNY